MDKRKSILGTAVSLSIPANEVRKNIVITVSEPISESKNIVTGFTLYKVTVVQSDFSPIPSGSCVQRRFRDFEWLITKLNSSNLGTIVPALPRKKTIGRFSKEFVESRCRALESCLQRIVASPALSSSPFFITFATESNASAFESAKASMKDDNEQFLQKSFVQTITSMIDSSKDSAVAKTDNDILIDDHISYYVDAEANTKKLEESSLIYAKALEKKANDEMQLARSLIICSKLESDSSSPVLLQVGSAIGAISTKKSSLSQEIKLKVFEPLQESVLLIQSAGKAIRRKETMQSNIKNAEVDLENARKALESEKSENRQAKQELVDDATRVLELSKQKLIEVSESLVKENSSFRSERGRCMQELLQNFITLQLTYNRESAVLMENIAIYGDQSQNINVDDNIDSEGKAGECSIS